MTYTPRTIAYLCELLHPPAEPDPRSVQRVHNELFQESIPLYRSYTETVDGAVLSNPQTQPGAVSTASFLRDRFQFREELTGGTREEFIDRVLRLTSLVLEARPMQLFTAQVVTIRTLINPRQFRDSRAFLREGVFQLGSELASLERDPQLYGMRLVFPPTPEDPHAFTLRVESFANDPRSLFLENGGSFGPIVVERGLEVIRDNVDATYDFVVDRVLPFLAHFDGRLPT